MQQTSGETNGRRLRLVVAVDGSEGSTEALRWTARLASMTGSEVIAVHALERPAYAGGYVPWMFGMASSPEGWNEEWLRWADRVRRQLTDEWCEPLRRAGVAFRADVILGGVGELLASIRDQRADLLIVGRRGLGGFRELVVGSFSHQLIHHSPIPVLVVPRHEQPVSPPSEELDGDEHRLTGRLAGSGFPSTDPCVVGPSASSSDRAQS